MGKWKGVILIIVLQLFYLLGCASEEVRETEPDVKQISCTFNQLDGECRFFSSFLGERDKGNSYSICSVGTCSEGDCENGKGVITYPGGSILEGFFKDGKLNGAGSYKGCSGSFVGTFKNDFKEKGIFVSKDSNKIYEGTFKDELKSGNFNVYLDYNQQFPFAENGKVLDGVYSKKITMPFIMDIDKNIYDSQEKQRKEEEARRKKDEEEDRKREAQRKIEQAKYEKEEQARSAQIQAEERKWQAEVKQIENSVNAKRAPVIKAKKACEESRYEFSNECKAYDSAKVSYEKYKSTACNIDYNEIRRKDRNAEQTIRRKEKECEYAHGSFE